MQRDGDDREDPGQHDERAAPAQRPDERRGERGEDGAGEPGDEGQRGQRAHPLFAALKAAQPGLLGSEAVKWNFTKFVVDRGGHVAARHAPTTTPEQLEAELARLLESLAPA